jgi:O-antigen biosynthesis protein
MTKLFVILGMHRSGTSVLTRCLQIFGIDLGDNLMHGMRDNPKGYWEDLDIAALNIEVLSSLKCYWDTLSPMEPHQVETLRDLGFIGRALEILAQKTARTDRFGFKDPRTAKLLPFWKEVFKQGGYETHYLLALRHPLSVCSSLKKRDSFETGKSCLLWLEHAINGLAAMTQENGIVVDYDQLLRSPETEARRIARQFDLVIDPSDLENFKQEFLEPSLRHAVHEDADLVNDPAVPPLLVEVYALLRDLAEDRLELGSDALMETQRRWRKEYLQLKPWLIYGDQVGYRLKQMAQSLSEYEQNEDELTRQVAEKDRIIQKLTSKLERMPLHRLKKWLSH